MATWQGLGYVKIPTGQTVPFRSPEELSQLIQQFKLDPANLGLMDRSNRPMGAAEKTQLTSSLPASVTAPPVTQQPITPPVTGPNQPSVPLDTPPLPIIPGLSTPETPINSTTAPSDISPYIPTTSQQQQNVVNQSIDQSAGVANQNFQDLQQSIAPYVQSQVQQGIGQSQNLAGQNLSQLQSLIGPYIQEQFSQYADPTRSGYQKLSGELNNAGVFNGSTFSQSLADKLAPLISQGAMDLGQQTLTPSFQNQQNMLSGGLQTIANQIPSIYNPSYQNQQNLVGAGAGIQSNLGLDSLNRFIGLQDWNRQKDLANQLADKGASAQFGSGIGGLLGGGLGAGLGAALAPTGMGLGGAMIGSAIGGQGGRAAGGGGGGMSWICNHLMKLGFATQEEVDAVHAKLWPTIIHHPAEWFAYFMMAPFLISCIDEPWEPIKNVLIDSVIEEPDSEKAWQIYRGECQRLTLKHAPLLWTMEVIPCR